MKLHAWVVCRSSGSFSLDAQRQGMDDASGVDHDVSAIKSALAGSQP